MLISVTFLNVTGAFSSSRLLSVFKNPAAGLEEGGQPQLPPGRASPSPDHRSLQNRLAAVCGGSPKLQEHSPMLKRLSKQPTGNRNSTSPSRESQRKLLPLGFVGWGTANSPSPTLPREETEELPTHQEPAQDSVPLRFFSCKFNRSMIA